MTLPSLDDFLTRQPKVLARGPVALILAEDGTELGPTVAHHLKAGFRSVVLCLPDGVAAPGAADGLHVVRFDTRAEGAAVRAVNRMIGACPPSTWLYWGYNAEYLFHPFCETRTVREMIAFHAEERRDAMLAYVLDLYPAERDGFPARIDREGAMFDAAGYYAQARAGDGGPKERQLDIFGGLGWRFEDHVPPAARRIDRIALFRAQKGLRMRDDHTFSIEEYNTYACPWHNNLTAAVMSFRRAKALDGVAGSFVWERSLRFDWTSRQLLELGMIEPGQWF